MSSKTTSSLVRAETVHAINGVAGRLLALHMPPAPWKPGTFANQRWISEKREVEGYGEKALLQVEMRFDDNCRNGHNDFAITGDIRGQYGRDIAGGCLHDDIARVFPELAPLIKWHLTSTDGPMHYIANAAYHASNRDCWGRVKGQGYNFEHRIKFGNSPLTKPLSSSLYKWLVAALEFNKSALKTNPDYHTFEPVAVEHGKSDYKYAPKWTLKGYTNEWHKCPFDTELEAEEFSLALRTLPFEFSSVPTMFSEGKERDFDAARRVANWPEATDEQLSLPKEELTKLLEARLPPVLTDFRRDMEAAGFMWAAPIRGQSHG